MQLSGRYHSLPQPIPRADGQAGHFEDGRSWTTTRGQSESEMAGTPTIWAPGTLSRSISSARHAAGRLSATRGTWFAAELAWLKKDLEENHSACTAAYWHQPTFSATNGITPEGIAAKAFWQLLYDHNADLVLNGHDHLYAHYRPLDPSGNYDPQKGIREFIVGTGGETLDPVVTTTVTSGTGETNMEDPTGNPNFNAVNLEAGQPGTTGV